MLLFAGLGNPEPTYLLHRHNLGFMAVDVLAEVYQASGWRNKHQSLIAECTIADKRILLQKPLTYMNRSGQALRAAMDFYKISIEEVTVWHDDLDLEPGRVRVKRGGGNGGHNGLKSIEQHIGNDTRRVRMGIGHPGSKDRVTPYVLSNFSKADLEWLEVMLGAISSGAPALVQGDDARFMTDYAAEFQAAFPKS